MFSVSTNIMIFILSLHDALPISGSGKTEVYFEAIAESLRKGQQTLVLLPEIALTEAFLRRFEDRFGAAPVRSEEHTSELQSPCIIVCRLLLENKKNRVRIHSVTS